MSHLRRRTVVKRVSSSGLHNNIEAHEESIASALQDASNRFKAINSRLEKYHKQKNEKANSSQQINWLRQRRDIDREEEKVTKQLETISIRIIPIEVRRSCDDGTGSTGEFRNDMRQILRRRRNPTSSHGKLARERLAITEDDLDDEMRRITEELKIIKGVVKHHRAAANGVKSILPKQVVDVIDDMRNEFDLVLSDGYVGGMGSMLEEDIQLFTNAWVANFTNLAERRDEAKTPSSGLTDDDADEWNERSRLVLRNAVRQWSKTRNANVKNALIKQVAMETNVDVSKCKSEWNLLELSSIAQGRDIGARHENQKNRNHLIKLALEDIEKMRRDIIDHISYGISRNLNDEISIEKEQRLDLLRSARRQMEERQRDEERRVHLIKEDESQRAAAKRQAELSIAGDKLRFHLECKEKEIRRAQAEDLKRRNDEEEARIQRLYKNGERYVYYLFDCWLILI